MTETTTRTAEPAFTAGAYRITFDRIGRSRPGPLVAHASSGPELAEAVYRYARRFVLSRELDVDVCFGGTGFLTVGVRDAGSFRWEAAS